VTGLLMSNNHGKNQGKTRYLKESSGSLGRKRHGDTASCN